MIITCPNCNARYRVKDDLMTGKGKRIKCKKCHSVFRAYSDRESKLEKMPDGSPAEVKRTPQVNGPGLLSPQATVKVDRSKLKDYLQNTEPVIPSTPPQEPPKQPNVQATVQIDRSQIDAFVKQGGPTANPAATTSDQLEQFLAKDLPDNPQPSASATVQIDPNAFSAFQEQIRQGEVPSVDVSSQPEPTPAPPAESRDEVEDFFASVRQLQPATPNQESEALETEEPPLDRDPSAEISFEEPSLDEFKVSDPAADPMPEQSPTESPIFGDIQKPEQEIADDPTITPPSEPLPTSPMDTLQPGPDVTSVPIQLFQARVEGIDYPNLSLEAVEKWIREGRLVEDDQIAPNGSDDFQRADTIPELKELFQKYFGNQAETGPTAEAPAKKKGFFARLFSIFKKK